MKNIKMFTYIATAKAHRWWNLVLGKEMEEIIVGNSCNCMRMT